MSDPQVQKPLRRSARLQAQAVSDHQLKIRAIPAAPGKASDRKKAPCSLSELSKNTDLKRKREPLQNLNDQIQEGCTQKRSGVSPVSRAVADISSPRAEKNIINETSPINHWIQEGSWPKKYFEPGSWAKEQFRQASSTKMLQERQRSTRWQSTGPTYPTLSDQKPRRTGGSPYMQQNYAAKLEAKGSFMDESDLDITDESKNLCQRLLDSEAATPTESLFRDDIFRVTCRKIQNLNESKVIQDIGRLIVPSVDALATCGAANLNHLVESVQKGWSNAIPFHGPRPQPDYAVGFGKSAFTDEQLKRLEALVGEIGDTHTSYFMATWWMYFPFLACEVKCGIMALDVADRQNAHSMTLAVRSVVELYKAVRREKELHRQILAFSISHDHRLVRIYGHYAILEDKKETTFYRYPIAAFRIYGHYAILEDKKETTFYRYPIAAFDFTSKQGKEKWTAYKFTQNVYDDFMPTHLKRICSAIDDLPSDVNFGLSQSASLSHASEAYV